MKKFSIISVLLILLLGGCTQKAQKVLVIFSYHAAYPGVVEEENGLDEILQSENVQVEKFYMDTKRKTNAEWKRKITNSAIKKIDEYNPDVVIVFDDNACELFAKKYIGEELPIVFAGMNNEPADYNFPAINITGVLERHKLDQSIELLLQIVPDVNSIGIITDSSATSREFTKRMEKLKSPVKISKIIRTNDWEKWKREIKKFQNQVDALGLFTYHTIKKKGGQESLEPEFVLDWTLKNSKLPGFDPLDFAIEGGVLCGVISSGIEQGKAAGEIALKILGGEQPSNIQIVNPTKGHGIVNEKRANYLKLEIPESTRPKAEVIN